MSDPRGDTWAWFGVNPSKAPGVFSPCGRYRYRLERTIGEAGGDPTATKVVRFTERHGGKRVLIGNKFAFIATDVKELRNASDPIGPENDSYLEQIMRDADVHVVAYGPLNKLPPKLRSRWLRLMTIAERVGCKLCCFGTASDGHPRHPLMLAYDTPIQEWIAP